jgi:glycine cleavage system H protein
MAELKFPDDVKYTKSDEWIRVEGDTATIGITDYAQDSLNDIVYVELPSVGDSFTAGQPFGEIESVKAASEINMPVAGEVIAVNDALESAAETVNSDPYGAGWIIKIKITDSAGLAGLMDAAAYKAYCDGREH